MAQIRSSNFPFNHLTRLVAGKNFIIQSSISLCETVEDEWLRRKKEEETTKTTFLVCHHQSLRPQVAWTESTKVGKLWKYYGRVTCVCSSYVQCGQATADAAICSYPDSLKAFDIATRVVVWGFIIIWLKLSAWPSPCTTSRFSFEQNKNETMK
jgi:hypothetical protein